MPDPHVLDAPPGPRPELTQPPQTDETRSDSRGRLPGLDGLRALAIVAVLTFHLNPEWLPGGFLGVDIFFVVSGFLITTLLVRERDRTGRLDLPAFWTRRARRLLPALLVCVPVSVLLARLVQADLLVGIGRQVLGALTFSTNWVEIGAGSDYFNSTTPQLFMNFWSLAVEEQFYLIWPLVTLGLLHIASPRLRTGLALAAAAGSALLMAVLIDPSAGATRVYYGTDTHLMGLMLGAALAFTVAGAGSAAFADATWQRLRRPATVVAAAILVVLLTQMDESASWTFRGGLLLACLVSTFLVAAAVSGQGSLPKLLELPPLRWIGERSYGIYLWHWPVILIVAQDMPSAPGASGYLSTRAWCVLVTLAIADLSYRFIETPIRQLGFRGAIDRLRSLLAGIGWSRGPAIIAGTLAVILLGTAAVIATAPDKTSTEKLIEANSGPATVVAGHRNPGTKATTGKPSSSPTAGAANWAMPKGKQIDVYGDSMVVGALHALRYYFPGIRIDARSNRQWSAGLAAVQASGDDVRRGVVLAFGTNAGVDEKTVRKTLNLLGPKRMVVLVNIHLNASRVSKDNATLAKIAADYPNVIVADWNSAVTAHPDQLQPDGIHPSLTGAHLYSKTIRQAFADLSEKHTGKKVPLKNLPIP